MVSSNRIRHRATQRRVGVAHHECAGWVVQNCHWEDNFQRLRITGNTFTRSGGPAMRLIGIEDSLIERNRIDSPVRASVIASPQNETDRQAIVLKNSQGVTLKANTLHDLENHTLPDAVSGSRMVGLEVTKEITLDGGKLPDAPADKLPQ